MKRKLRSIVCLCGLISIVLCACEKEEQGNPIRLPAREDIVSIGVSDGDKYARSPNTEVEATEFIDEFLFMLMDMETTSQQSVNEPSRKEAGTGQPSRRGARTERPDRKAERMGQPCRKEARARM